MRIQQFPHAQGSHIFYCRNKFHLATKNGPQTYRGINSFEKLLNRDAMRPNVMVFRSFGSVNVLPTSVHISAQFDRTKSKTSFKSGSDGTSETWA